MQPRVDHNVLVLVGGWNPNVLLNVDWLKKYLLPEAKSFKLEMAVSAGRSGPTRISTDSVRISLTGPKLSLARLRPEDSLLDTIEEFGIRIADYLPHTPVTGAGINFLFQDESKPPTLTMGSEEAKGLMERIGGIEEELHRYTIRTEQSVLNLAVQQPTDGIQSYDFNFHLPLETLADFKEKIAEYHIIEYKDQSRKNHGNDTGRWTEVGVAYERGRIKRTTPRRGHPQTGGISPCSHLSGRGQRYCIRMRHHNRAHVT